MAGHSPSKTGVNALMSRPFSCALRAVKRTQGAGADRNNPIPGELVRAFVHGVTGMAFHPVPMHLVMLQGRVEPLPEIDVLDRFLVGGAPAVTLPPVDPFRNPLPPIFALRMPVEDRNSTRLTSRHQILSY